MTLKGKLPSLEGVQYATGEEQIDLRKKTDKEQISIITLTKIYNCIIAIDKQITGFSEGKTLPCTWTSGQFSTSAQREECHLLDQILCAGLGLQEEKGNDTDSGPNQIHMLAFKLV